MEPTGLFNDYDQLRFWLEAVKAVGLVIVGLVGFWLGRWRAMRRQQDDLKEELTDVVERQTARIADLRSDLTALERQVESLPSHDDLGQVYSRISTMDNNLSKLIGQVEGMTRGLDNINNFLLHASKGDSGA